VIEKVTSDSLSEPKIEPKVHERSSIHSSETYLKPNRDRSPKQIEWSRELGIRSKEFKLKKKEKNYEITTVEEAPVVPEVKEVNKYYLSPYLGIGFLIICGGGVYWFAWSEVSQSKPI
jgi:hypothetical protein